MAVTIETVYTTLDTGGGTQDITFTGFGTPKAALFEMVQATTTGTLAAENAGSYGATDGTNQWCYSHFSEDNQASSDSYNNRETDEVITVLTATGTIGAEANFNSWITDGVRINWGVTPGSAFLLKVTLIGGDDVSADCGVNTVGNSTDTTTSITTTFRPVLVFGALSRGAVGTVQNHGHHSRGFAHENGAGTVTQYALGWNSRDNRASGEPQLRLEDRGIVCQLLNGGGLDWYGELGNFSATGFDIITRNGGGNNQGFGWLALAFSGAVEASVFFGDTPTSTGETTGTDDNETNPGLEPQWVSTINTNATAFQTGYLNNQAGFWGQSYMTDSEQHSSVYLEEDAAPTTNTACSFYASAYRSFDDDQTTKADASWVSWQANGYRLDFSSVDTGTARRYIGVAIGTEDTGISGELDVTLDALTVDADGEVLVDGGSTITLADVTISSDGTVLVDGGASITLDDVTISSDGQVLIDGQLNVTLDDATLSSTGVVQNEIQGTLNVTLDDVSISSDGEVLIEGQASITLDDATLSSDGQVLIDGGSTITLDDATLDSQGGSGTTGQLNITLDDLSRTIEGEVAIQGQLAVTLDDLGRTIEGEVPVQGQLSVTLDDVTASSEGDVVISGQLSVTLDDLGIDAQGVGEQREGQLNVTLDDVTLVSGDVIPGDGMGSRTKVAVSVGL